MDPPAFTLRTPGPADAAALADLHIETWRETYGQQMPAAAFGERARQSRLDMWQGMLDFPGQVGTLRVAEVEGELVGFAGAAPSTDGDAAHRLELRMLYVRAAFHGTGAGQQLLDSVIGDKSAFLWVAKDNPRARRFYVRNGFIADGGERLEQGSAAGLVAVRLVRQAPTPHQHDRAEHGPGVATRYDPVDPPPGPSPSVKP